MRHEAQDREYSKPGENTRAGVNQRYDSTVPEKNCENRTSSLLKDAKKEKENIHS